MGLTSDLRLHNHEGPLPASIREDLALVLADPQQYWGDMYSYVLRADHDGLTLWKAVIAVDPTFPHTGPRFDAKGRMVQGWTKIPDQVTVARALKYAANLPRRYPSVKATQ